MGLFRKDITKLHAENVKYDEHPLLDIIKNFTDFSRNIGVVHASLNSRKLELTPEKKISNLKKLKSQINTVKKLAEPLESLDYDVDTDLITNDLGNILDELIKHYSEIFVLGENELIVKIEDLYNWYVDILGIIDIVSIRTITYYTESLEKVFPQFFTDKEKDKIAQQLILGPTQREALNGLKISSKILAIKDKGLEVDLSFYNKILKFTQNEEKKNEFLKVVSSLLYN